MTTTTKRMVLPAILLLAAMAAAQTNQSVPAGTALRVKLNTTLATFSNRVGDQFQGSLTQPVVLNGQTMIPAGARIEGRVTKLSEPRRISGKPTIGILPEAVIMPTGQRYFLDATLAGAFVARWCVGAKVETAGGVFRVREDEPEPRVGAGPHRTP